MVSVLVIIVIVSMVTVYGFVVIFVETAFSTALPSTTL